MAVCVFLCTNQEHTEPGLQLTITFQRHHIALLFFQLPGQSFSSENVRKCKKSRYNLSPLIQLL